MNEEKQKQIFEAIKNDDLNLLKSLVLSNSDLNLCFGRFPLLSLCYLYESYKILEKYEKYMFQIRSYNVTEEYFEMYSKLKSRAKKSLRLYLNDQIISPLEMLAILDERQKIAKDYQKFYKNSEITANIEKIYSLTNKTQVIATVNNFESPKKKLGTKGKLFTIIVSVLMCFMILLPTFSILIVRAKSGLGTFSSPIHISTEEEFKKALNKGRRFYILDEDIVLTSDFSVNTFSGTISGNGKTVYAGSNLSGALIKNLTGKVLDLNLSIEYEDLVVNKNTAFLAETLSGTIKNCTVSGSVVGTFANNDDAYLSLFVLENKGLMENSVASVNVNITNPTEKNAFLSAYSAQNFGSIISCNSSDMEFETDTVDSACFAIDNSGTIDNCENNLKITQTSAGLWHPNTSGIVINNAGTIKNTKNNANISSSSTNEVESSGQNTIFVIYASGIVVENNGKITDVENNGEISSNSIVARTFASGIAVTNNAEISGAVNNGRIFASSQKLDIFASGIACYNTFTYQTSGLYFNFTSISSMKSCENNGEIVATSSGDSSSSENSIGIYAGGIVSFNYTNIEDSNNNGYISVDCKFQEVYIGGIVGISSYTNSFSQYINIFIKNCISKGDISGRSENSTVSAGGICGYNSRATIESCGFIGNISSFALNNYVGGICGGAQLAKITNSYSSASFENKNSSSSINYFGAFIGYFMGFNYDFSSNKYVQVNNVPALWFYSSSGVSEIVAGDANLTTYKSLQELLNSLGSEAKND